MTGNYIYRVFDYSENAWAIVDLFKDEPNLFFLESSLYDKDRGRYSFLGFDPFKVVQFKGEGALQRLKEEYATFAYGQPLQDLSLSSGIVGFLSYDGGLYQERIPWKPRPSLGLPDCCFGFYDVVITIDHLEKKFYVTSSGLPEKNSLLRRKRAQARLAYVVKKLSQVRNGSEASRPISLNEHEKQELKLSSNFSKGDYLKAVTRALDYIGRGDIYQVNLSQRFKLEKFSRAVSSLEIYRSLRDLSPSPFGGYFNAGDFQIVSSSPERFLHVRDRAIETRPMKGTSARSMDVDEDKKLKRKLLDSAKDVAELLMITDLERNDLGKVCRYGTVRVKEMRTIESYMTVYQATSTVEGILKDGMDVFDCIRACFPGGSITGCPKIRAMEVIEELEPDRREIYTGALGYIGFGGQMDLNILIRSLLVLKDSIYFHVGSGIVADSVPELEYEETLLKARAIELALAHVFGMKNKDVEVSPLSPFIVDPV